MLYYRNQTDETLVMLTLAGEQRAYEALVVKYQKRVISAAVSVTRNNFMAEDAAQDAFATAWMKLNTLQDPKKFPYWVCKIAKNCALNMVSRFRSFLPIDTVSNLTVDDGQYSGPEKLYTLSEEKNGLYQSIGKLPETVKKIIYMHYFEGLSVSEIAERMNIPEGTAKWRLHDGRKRIRKDLCAMDEKYSDTLVRRVMKKVDELMLWQTKNSKSGFEIVYNDVLKEAEELPESREKYCAIADVLMRGWWWIPGEKSEALFSRIKEAALSGENDEVMEFIVTREDFKVYGDARIEFIRDKQIPMLEKTGFVRTLAREWFWLGYSYYKNNQTEKAMEAYRKVLEISDPSNKYYALALRAIDTEKKFFSYLKKDDKTYRIGIKAEELRYIDNRICYWNVEEIGEGHLISTDIDINYIFRNSSLCDGLFFDKNLSVGESYTGSDGTTLTYASDNITVETPCGTFDGCRLWIIKHFDEYSGVSVYKSYYKDGVGIVKHEHKCDGITDVRILKDYNIAGGSGMLPLAAGNTWKYADGYSPDVMQSSLEISVSHLDKASAVISSFYSVERLKYDENSWIDMIEKIRSEYCKTENGKFIICDVSSAIKRAESLARTPVETAHAKTAGSVARRIMETDVNFNPNFTSTGCWNFFSRNYIFRKNDTVLYSSNLRWSFEYKKWTKAYEPLLYNDIYGILYTSANCLWSDEWRIGSAPIIEYMYGDSHIKTEIICEDGGTVATKAGIFENCFKLSMNTTGLAKGLEYRGNSKEYYFADGVGIVRTVNQYNSGALHTVYELTSYKGTGKGYMPFEDGMERRYDAIGLTDGFVGSAEYIYVEDEDGQIAIFSDRTGVQEKLSPVTLYSSIQGEIIEEQLWEGGYYDESRLRHGINNFNIMTHFLGRPSRYWGNPEKAVAWNKYRMQIIEGFGENGEIPRAWLGCYAATCFRTACALFGCGINEEGYEYLERTFDLFKKWDSIPDGEAIEVGNDLIYGGIKVIKGKGIIRLPDGRTEVNYGDDLFSDDISLVHYGLTAAYGWEWFNGVRKEERYLEYVDRAVKTVENR